MIDYLTINYGLNYSYNLNQEVFKAIVLKAKKSINALAVIENLKVNITHNCTNIAISFDFMIPQNADLKNFLWNLKSKIVDYVVNLIDTTPSNIKMTYRGRI